MNGRTSFVWESRSISSVNDHYSLRPFSKQLFFSLGSFEIESVNPELGRKNLIKVTVPPPRDKSLSLFSHALCQVLLPVLQWNGFSFVPTNTSSYSIHYEMCPHFPSLHSSLLSFTPLLTATSLWTTANDNPVKLTFSS